MVRADATGGSSKIPALSGSGPRWGKGGIWYHDNLLIQGVGPNGKSVYLRTHSANPNAPVGSLSSMGYTTQLNTKKGLYRLPDGQWETVKAMSLPERAAALFPAGN